MSIGLLSSLSIFSPIIISCSILIFSLFAMVIGKGLFYIFWLLVVTGIRIAILSIIDLNNKNTELITKNIVNPICNTFNFLPYDNTFYSTFVLCFTFFYFTTQMYITNNINYLIVIFFISYILFDIGIKIINSCVNFSTTVVNSFGNLFGNIIGGSGLGVAISYMIYYSPMNNYLFMNELHTNKEICSMPSKQKFKCAVYKNGELISSLA
jgi:hypothetical protein